jgi:hypothetical protein
VGDDGGVRVEAAVEAFGLDIISKLIILIPTHILLKPRLVQLPHRLAQIPKIPPILQIPPINPLRPKIRNHPRKHMILAQVIIRPSRVQIQLHQILIVRYLSVAPVFIEVLLFEFGFAVGDAARALFFELG